MDQSNPVPLVESVVTGLRWFTPDGAELARWCKELVSNLSLPAKSAVTLSVGLSAQWKQPRLLKLPRNYDQIFQVRCQSYKSTIEFEVNKFWSFSSFITNDLAKGANAFQKIPQFA